MSVRRAGSAVPSVTATLAAAHDRRQESASRRRGRMGQFRRSGQFADPNQDINLLGIGLGEHPRRRTGVLIWAVVVAAEGPEIALHGQPRDIYPTNAVAKRWTAHETGFLRSYAEDMSAAVARISAAGTGPA